MGRGDRARRRARGRASERRRGRARPEDPSRKADDYCDGEQAIAAANKLIAEGVDFVMGHECSDAAIPASQIYAKASILMINPGATMPLLTEQGLANVFRIRGRSDRQGAIAARLLAERWGDQRIAILHDGQAFGRDIAEQVKKALNARGVREAMFEGTVPGLTDYGPGSPRSSRRVSMSSTMAAVRPRRASSFGSCVIAATICSSLGAPASTARISGLSPARRPTAPYSRRRPIPAMPAGAAVLAAFRATGYEPFGPAPFQAYGAVQVWAQAVEKAGTLELHAVIDSLRSHEFDTIYGAIGFDEKGDVIGYETFVWYIWQGGKYAPVDPDELTE